MPHSYEFKLQIVCGTYNRTDSAIRLIKSAIPHLNEDIGLVVHSNSPDKKLKHFMKSKGLSKYYGEHTENKGGLENFRSAIKLTNAKYIMLLSDEDELESKDCFSFLKKFHESSDYFAISQIPNYFTMNSESDLTYNRSQALIRFSWVITYLSGFIFPSSIVKDEDFDVYFNDCSYTHLIYKMMMGNNDKLIIPSKPYIKKNEDVEHGGDAYEHINLDTKNELTKIYKNSSVYGYEARVSQFYNLAHLQKIFGVHGWRRFFVLAELLAIWTSAYHQSPIVTKDGFEERLIAVNAHSKYYSRWPSYKILKILFKFMCSRFAYVSGISRAYSYAFKLLRRRVYKINWS